MSGKQTAQPAVETANPTEALTSLGLDPSLVQGLLDGNPIAVQAAAALMGNAAVAAALGRAPEERPGARAEATAEEARESRQLDPNHPEDGSGAHGRLDPVAADHANHVFWRGVAVSAEGMGLVNAARHMNHYLDNTGGPLDVDLSLIASDLPEFQARHDLAVRQIVDDALSVLDGADTTYAGSWTAPEIRFDAGQTYFEQDDWYFAVGGHQEWMDGQVHYVPDLAPDGNGTIELSLDWHLYDDYNWDGGKSVTIAGVTVNDEVLGRLHQVGLAQEYPIEGDLHEDVSVRFTGQKPGNVHPEDLPAPADERTGRDDADRERQ